MATVRLATAADAPALARISNEIHAMHVAGQPSAFKAGNGDVFTAERMSSLLGAEGNFMWVAETGQTVAGFAHATVNDEPDTPWRAGMRVLELRAMGVTTSHRGHGIGTRLLDAVLAMARAHDVRDVRLTVWAFNEDARRFYRRHGFTLRNEPLEHVMERDDDESQR